MAQSVELLLDESATGRLTAQWEALHLAGLPSLRRPGPDPDHRPHITLYAADRIPDEAEQALPGSVTGLPMPVRIGALMLFGPRRGQYVLVRQVLASPELLQLQSRVAELCRADPRGSFGPGGWSPHVTLARRMPGERVGAALAALERFGDSCPARVVGCRRWDGNRKQAWLLTP